MTAAEGLYIIVKYKRKCRGWWMEKWGGKGIIILLSDHFPKKKNVGFTGNMKTLGRPFLAHANYKHANL